MGIRVAVGQFHELTEERLRFAAQTCVDENLRVSLERAAQGEVAAEELALIEAEAVAHEARAGAPPAGRAAR